MSDDINPFEDDEEAPEPQAERKQNNQFEALNRKYQKLEKEAEELRAFKAERAAADRSAAVSKTFSEVGLQPEWAEFYQGEEVTPEAVKQWAVTKKFLTPSEEVEEAAPEPTTGFTPTVVAGSAVPGSKVYPFDEWMALSQTEPEKAAALWKAGRVAEAIRD